MKNYSSKSKGFTLAEVVITLIVIEVVSAITIPMLHNDVNDKKWNVARQKALFHFNWQSNYGIRSMNNQAASSGGNYSYWVRCVRNTALK